MLFITIVPMNRTRGQNAVSISPISQEGNYAEWDKNHVLVPIPIGHYGEAAMNEVRNVLLAGGAQVTMEY